MAEYYNVTTNLGDAEIANAIATNTKLNITHIAFGDGNGSVPTPSKSRTSLVREVHRQTVTKYERHPTNANWIIIETIIPSSVGGFWVREMGIIANGKLISHGSHAPFEKVADPSGVSEYRLRFTQNVTDGSVVEITLDESLIYASQAWVEENFIKRSEIVDNLTTDDADKVASAAQVKILNDDKANKTTTLTAGNGLSGGGTLEINRTLTLGTPSKITGSTTNSVTATSHTHEIDNASTSVAGVVKLNNTLTSTSTTEAATAAQIKVLNDQMFGVGQTYKNITIVSGTTYTNTSPKLIFILVTLDSTASWKTFSAKVDEHSVGAMTVNNNYSQGSTIPIPIPSGSDYSFVFSGSGITFKVLS
ncbi:phage tail protein [Acinetobacter faecalis]|uniref:Phage tail protein n=1 Tax=Acinetobacter faecalis TaxID=2665161 RepID=A0ABU5GJW3_9GAMM|nr:phage tail protein [Acinetobacter faecalis]MDY6550779.1 phage tail protein [Acinetobacter faecalis]